MGITSCGSINYLEIETYNPAEITFPEQVGKILIVNNAVPQPERSVCNYTYMGVMQDTCKVSVDSALIYACRTLGKAILEGDYFHDVLLYNEPLRTDNGFLAEQKLTSDRVDDLCRETSADAVISLEKLLFVLKKEVKKTPEGYVEGTIRMDMGGMFRAYLPNRATPLASVQMNDSIFWSESGLVAAELDFLLPSFEEAVKIAGIYYGGKIYPNFVPYWQNETRWYYSSLGSDWKRASAFVRAGKWSEAGDVWKQLYQRASKEKTKAQAATNIALACEMEGLFDEALEWVGKASTLWKDNVGEDNRDRRLGDLYKEALQERIRLNRKLDQQIGKE